ncbi:hypothetical protein SEVIR_9G245910v4 [Setaria viridis]
MMRAGAVKLMALARGGRPAGQRPQPIIRSGQVTSPHLTGSPHLVQSRNPSAPHRVSLAIDDAKASRSGWTTRASGCRDSMREPWPPMATCLALLVRSPSLISLPRRLWTGTGLSLVSSSPPSSLSFLIGALRKHKRSFFCPIWVDQES